MAIVAELFEHVVGIDTHARTQTCCLIACATGAVVDAAVFPTTKSGNARAISWIVRRTGGSVLAAVEGTSSYGAGMTAALGEAGFQIAEVRPAAQRTHAHSGKSDAIDAEAAARAVLCRDFDKLARPRQSGQRAALRVLLALTECGQGVGRLWLGLAPRHGRGNRAASLPRSGVAALRALRWAPLR